MRSCRSRTGLAALKLARAMSSRVWDDDVDAARRTHTQQFSSNSILQKLAITTECTATHCRQQQS